MAKQPLQGFVMQWYAMMILKSLNITEHHKDIVAMTWCVRDMFTLQKHNSVRHFHLRRSSNIPARIPMFWGRGRFARLGQTSFCCNMCEFISFMWALILLISLPILVRLTELRARNIIQISTVGPGRQRQHQTLHRDTRCDTFSLSWGTKAWPEVPVDKSMCLSCSMSRYY